MYNFLYNFLSILIVLIFGPILFIFSVSSKKYRYVFRRRLFTHFQLPDYCCKNTRIWIHALSVGEVFSAEALVKEIALRCDKVSVVFTVSTSTGYEVAQKYIKSYVSCINYFPYDILWLLPDIIRIISPIKVIFIETDLWPNLLFLLKKRGIATYLINARMTGRSYKNFKIFNGFARHVFSLLEGICVQSEMDKTRFTEIGVSKKKIFVSGNMKFDQNQVILSDKELQEFKAKFRLSCNRPVWVAGSTHDGEESIIAGALEILVKSGIMPVLIVAPRDPERSDEICDIFKSIKTKVVVEKSSNLLRSNIFNKVDVVIVDHIGVLKSLYVLSDVTFVGGSMVDEGGHNMLEPAIAGKPVLFGPYTDDFRNIAIMLENSGGGIRVRNVENLAAEVASLLQDSNKASKIGHIAYKFSNKYTGSVVKTLKFVGLIS